MTIAADQFELHDSTTGRRLCRILKYMDHSIGPDSPNSIVRSNGRVFVFLKWIDVTDVEALPEVPEGQRLIYVEGTRVCNKKETDTLYTVP